jgi:pullulanase
MTEFDENSYASPDAVNSLKWNSITDQKEVVDYYKGLIAFRKSHSALRMTKREELETRLRFLKWLDPNLIAYIITHPTEGDLCVIFNANRSWKPVHVPEGIWKVYVKGNRAGIDILEENTGGVVNIEPISTLVMVKQS